MEAKAASGVKVMILSSPHNPTGRVWTRQELEGVAEICLRHNIFMLVDEIHCDFVPPEHPHTTFCLAKAADSDNCSGRQHQNAWHRSVRE